MTASTTSRTDRAGVALAIGVATDEIVGRPTAALWRSQLNAGTLAGRVTLSEPTFPYDDEYGSCVATYSTLRLFSDEVPPLEISSALKLEPTSSFIKGEPISPRVNRPRPQHGWLLCSKDRVISRDTRRHPDLVL